LKIRNTFGGVGLFALSLTASALSLGQSQGQAVLGAPLDLVFQLEPNPGLDAASSCVAAEVVMGERRVDASRISVRPLSTRAGQPAAVRVRAAVVIDEPVVVVRLTAGCDGQMSRSYTFFAELPDAVARSAMPLDIAQLSATPPAVAAREPARRARPPAPAAASASARNDAAPAPAPRPRKPAPKPPAAPAVPAASAAAPATPGESRLRMEPLDAWLGPNAADGAATGRTSTARPTPAASASTAASTAAAAAPAAVAAGAAAPAAVAAGAPAPAAPISAPAAPAMAASPAPGADAAAVAAPTDASAAGADPALLALQAEMKALRAAEARNNAQLAQMRSQLEALQSDQGSSWTIPLLAALAIALLVLAWLLMRLRSLTQAPPASAWLHSVSGGARGDDGGSSPGVFAQGASVSGPVTVTSLPAAFAAAKEDFGQSTLHASEVHDYHPMPVHHARELVKPEDLFDVRQQAEFFTSVGEYEQAIAVLRKHIDEHQDSSPLAYLELLGLFYQLSRRADYDALRTQFEQYFAAHVPEMAQFAQRGRSLAHYPELLARIEAQWPTEQVCELLEGYLLRNAGQPGGVLFDLEAFDDLMLLQAVARTTPASARGVAVGRIRTTPDAAPEPEAQPTPPSALADVALAAAAVSTGVGQVPPDAPWATLERAQTAVPTLVPVPPVLAPEPLSLDIPSTFDVPEGAFARSAPLSTESTDTAQPPVPSLLDIDLSDVGRFEPLDLPEVEALPFDLEEFPKRSIVGSGVDQVPGSNAADPKLPPASGLELTPWEEDESPDSIFSAWNAARTDRVIAKPPADDGDKDKPEPGRG